MSRRAFFRRADSSTCRAKDLYVSPEGGSTINEGSVTFSWKPECLGGATKIDIYLYSQLQQSASIPIHAWTGIDPNARSIDVSLDSRWWNGTKEARMNHQIVRSGHQPWDTRNPISQTWKATSLDGGDSQEFNIVKMGLITDMSGSSGLLSHGALAAAVVCPIIGSLIIIIALFIFIHRRRRDQRIKERKEMSERSAYVPSVAPQSPPQMEYQYSPEQMYHYQYPTDQHPYPEQHLEQSQEQAENKSSEHQSLASMSDPAITTAFSTGADTLQPRGKSPRKGASRSIESRKAESRLDKWDSDFWYVKPEQPEDRNKSRRRKRGDGRPRGGNRPKRKGSGDISATIERHVHGTQEQGGSLSHGDYGAEAADIVPEYGPAYGEGRSKALLPITSSIPPSLLGPRCVPEPDWAPEPTGQSERDAKIAAYLAQLPRPGESYDYDNVSQSGYGTRTSMHSATSDVFSNSEFADAATHAHGG